MRDGRWDVSEEKGEDESEAEGVGHPFADLSYPNPIPPYMHERALRCSDMKWDLLDATSAHNKSNALPPACGVRILGLLALAQIHGILLVRARKGSKRVAYRSCGARFLGLVGLLACITGAIHSRSH